MEPPDDGDFYSSDSEEMELPSPCSSPSLLEMMSDTSSVSLTSSVDLDALVISAENRDEYAFNAPSLSSIRGLAQTQRGRSMNQAPLPDHTLLFGVPNAHVLSPPTEISSPSPIRPSRALRTRRGCVSSYATLTPPMPHRDPVPPRVLSPLSELTQNFDRSTISDDFMSSSASESDDFEDFDSHNMFSPTPSTSPQPLIPHFVSRADSAVDSLGLSPRFAQRRHASLPATAQHLHTSTVLQNYASPKRHSGSGNRIRASLSQDIIQSAVSQLPDFPQINSRSNINSNTSSSSPFRAHSSAGESTTGAAITSDQATSSRAMLRLSAPTPQPSNFGRAKSMTLMSGFNRDYFDSPVPRRSTANAACRGSVRQQHNMNCEAVTSIIITDSDSEQDENCSENQRNIHNGSIDEFAMQRSTSELHMECGASRKRKMAELKASKMHVSCEDVTALFYGMSPGTWRDQRVPINTITNSENPDLDTITVQTLVSLLNEPVGTTFSRIIIIDCRYPYEYDGGHIKDAINLHTKDLLENEFPAGCIANTGVQSKTAFVFHCEFSSKRGPSMYRHLRALDRQANYAYYPQLFYPNLFLLKGGYKEFYETFKSRCEPQEYILMKDARYSQQLTMHLRESRRRGSKKPRADIS